MTDMITQLNDINQIKDLVHGFAFRDQGKWPELRELFAEDATVAISWFHGPASAFVDACALGYANAPPKTSVKHLLGFPRIRISGNRAYADTDATILMRVPFGEKRVMLDVTSWCRFCHLLEKRDGAWKIVHWTAIYEKDRFEPSAFDGPLTDVIDIEVFGQQPYELGAMAYLFLQIGQSIQPSTIVRGSEEERELSGLIDRWLGGERDMVLLR